MASHLLSSDLQFQMKEAGVSLCRRAEEDLYEKGLTCLRTFADIEESRASARGTLKTHSNVEFLRETVLLLSVWEAARAQLTYQEKNKQDSKLGAQHRSVQATEYAAMRKAAEPQCGSLKGKEAPSKSLVRAGRGWSPGGRRSSGGHLI